MKEGVVKVGHALESAANEVIGAFEDPPVTPGDPLTPSSTLVDLGPDGTPPGRPQLFGATRSGKSRTTNEDQFLLAEFDRSMRVYGSSSLSPAKRIVARPQGWVLMVADGIGGHAAGEVASEVAINTLATYAFSLMPWSFSKPGADAPALAEGLQHAVRKCQQNIERTTNARHLAEVPGTTLTAAYVAWPNLYVVHVGDSRCYVLRGGQLYQITHDHTLASEGELGPDEAGPAHESDPAMQNVLLNAVGGTHRSPQPELRHSSLQANDIVFLCTDGVTDVLSDEELTEHLTDLALGTTPNVGPCIQGILRTAEQRGGPDNMTAVIGKF